MMTEPDDLPDDLLRLAASMPPAVFDHALSAHKLGAPPRPEPVWCSYRPNCRAARPNSPHQRRSRSADPRLQLRRLVRNTSASSDGERPARHAGKDR